MFLGWLGFGFVTTFNLTSVCGSVLELCFCFAFASVALLLFRLIGITLGVYWLVKHAEMKPESPPPEGGEPHDKHDDDLDPFAFMDAPPQTMERSPRV
jgi:hypothetical protein